LSESSTEARGFVADLDERRAQLVTETAERPLGRPDLAPHSCRQPREEHGPREGGKQRQEPHHSSRLPVQRPTHFGGEAVEPVIGLQEQVEVEQVVGRERRSGAQLTKLRGQSPYLHAHAAGYEEVDDASACFLGDGPTTVRAPEAVRTAFVVGADANRQVVARELYVTTAGAVRSDRRHCVRPS
jgi:hypothetical protein